MDKMLGKVLNSDLFCSPSKLYGITSQILGISLGSDHVYNYKYVELEIFCILEEGKTSIIINLKPV